MQLFGKEKSHFGCSKSTSSTKWPVRCTMQKVVIGFVVYFLLSQNLLHRFLCLFMTLNLWGVVCLIFTTCILLQCFLWLIFVKDIERKWWLNWFVCIGLLMLETLVNVLKWHVSKMSFRAIVDSEENCSLYFHYLWYAFSEHRGVVQLLRDWQLHLKYCNMISGAWIVFWLSLWNKSRLKCCSWLWSIGRVRTTRCV